jgi:hypothetical protein
MMPLINVLHTVKQQSNRRGSEGRENRNWRGVTTIKQQMDGSEATGVATALSIHKE